MKSQIYEFYSSIHIFALILGLKGDRGAKGDPGTCLIECNRASAGVFDSESQFTVIGPKGDRGDKGEPGFIGVSIV